MLSLNANESSLQVVRSGEPGGAAQRSRVPLLPMPMRLLSVRAFSTKKSAVITDIPVAPGRELPSVTVSPHNRILPTPQGDDLLAVTQLRPRLATPGAGWLFRNDIRVRAGMLRDVHGQRSGQPRRPRTSRQRDGPASVRHQRPAVNALGLRNRDVLSMQPRTAMPRSTRNLPAIGHLQQRSPILRITARPGWRVQREFLTFSERAVALAPQNAVPGPGRRRR